MNKKYETDSYLKECDGVIVECIQKDEYYFAKISDTIFFPEEGGQYADTGYLIPEGASYEDKVMLLDGQLVNGEIIYKLDHYIEPGTGVREYLNWNERFSRMQQHTGEHIVSGAINKKYGYNNVGFHLSDDSFVTLDMDGVLTQEQTDEIEREVNRIITKNLEIKLLFPDKEELKNIDYRSKKEIDGQVRLVMIGDGADQADMCACCAPHVARTGEIGQIVFTQVQKYKGGTRISMLAGDRAAAYIQENLRILSSLAKQLTTSASEISMNIRKQKDEISELKAKISGLMEEKINSLLHNSHERNKCIFTNEGISSAVIRKAIEKNVSDTEGYIAVFLGNDEVGYSYTISSLKLEVCPLQKNMSERLGAKGGGKEPMISGRLIAKKEDIEKFFAET